MTTKRKILIVDSSIEEAKNLQSALEHAGFEILWSQNGDEAYSICLKEQPSIVLSELFLPGLNGVQLFNKLRLTYSTQHIPFVVITTEKEREERIKSMQLGIDDYISKPFYVEEVVARVEMLLSETEVIEETRKSLEHGFSGSLSEMNLVDLIQTMEVGDKSAVLRLLRNGQEGVVYINHGNVLDVTMGKMDPNRALENMLTWIDGKFIVEIQHVAREHLIKFTNKEILEYGTKKIHEWRQLSNQLPNLDIMFKISDSIDFDKLSKEEKEVAEFYKSGCTIRKAVESSKLDDILFLRITKQLLNRNLLIEAGTEQLNHNTHFELEREIQNHLGRDNHNDIYSRISSFFNKNNNGEEMVELERRRGDRRQNLDRRSNDRRKNGSTKRQNRIYLSKDELLLIRQKLL